MARPAASSKQVRAGSMCRPKIPMRCAMLFSTFRNDQRLGKQWAETVASTSCRISHDSGQLKTTFAFRSENPDALCDAVLHLSQRPALRQAMGRNGREYIVQNLSRQRTAEDYLRVPI